MQVIRLRARVQGLTGWGVGLVNVANPLEALGKDSSALTIVHEVSEGVLLRLPA